ncbi:hypothetical protein PENSPDRAFT_676641 [Peniophora sp. CONT]|nr:hypothetical protein PENSPDRAFT_676641 [Peniophora sp. CONT]
MADSHVVLLLQTTLISIAQVFLVAVSGFFLARAGLLPRNVQQALNRLNISLFTPSLIFAKVAFSLSPEKFKELWIVPLFFIALSIVSAAVAFALSLVFRLSRTQRNFAIAASMFMNSNSLPIALLQSLVYAVPGLGWGEDDTHAQMLGRALTYLTLCSTLGMILRWSVGVRLLAAADPTEDAVPQMNGNGYHRVPGHPDENTALLSDAEEGDDDYPGVPAITLDPSTPTLERGPIAYREQSVRVYRSFPNTPGGSRVQLAPDSPSPPLLALPSEVSGSEDDDQDTLTFSTRSSTRQPGRMDRMWRRAKKAFKAFNDFMTMPLYASVVSIIVALWPDLQHTLDVHITPVKGAVGQLGNCSIPITLVVLGAYFYRESPSEKGEDGVEPRGRAPVRAEGESWWRRSKSLFSLRSLVGGKSKEMKQDAAPRGEARTVFVAIVSRMVLVPALVLPFMAWGASVDTPPVFEDPVFILSLVLLLGSPPALTLSQMTHAVGGDAFERLISRTIFWSYCIVTPPATIVLAVIAMLIEKL